MWVSGYRDGWDGKQPPAIAPGAYAKGWVEGSRDRRHNVARPEYASLVKRPAGTKWTDRR